MIEKMASIKQTLGSLVEQLRKIEQKNRELAERGRALVADNDVMKGVRVDFKKAQERVEALEIELAGLRGQNVDAERRHGTALGEATREREERDATIVRLGEEVAGANERERQTIAKLAEIEQARERLLDKLNRLEDENGRLKGDVEEAQRMIEEFAGGFRQLGDSFDAMHTELTGYKTDGDGESAGYPLERIGNEEIERLRGVIATQERKIETLDKELARARDLVPQEMRFKIDELRRENDDLVSRLEAARAEREHVAGVADTLQRELDERKIRLAEAETAADEAVRLKADLERKSDVIDHARDSIGRSKETEERIAGLKEKIVALENELALRRERTDQAEAERESLAAELNRVKEQFKTVIRSEDLDQFGAAGDIGRFKEENRRLADELEVARRAALPVTASGDAAARAFEEIRAIHAEATAAKNDPALPEEEALVRDFELIQRIFEIMDRQASPAPNPAPLPTGSPPPKEVDGLLSDVEKTYKELFGG